jgi:hypothetical protein
LIETLWPVRAATRRHALATRAITLAGTLVRQKVDDDAVVTQLRDVGGGSPALQEAAAIMARPAAAGYPHSRVHRLLLIAAGRPRAPLTSEEQETEAAQRLMWEQPPPVSFRRLAGLVPALAELERKLSSDADRFLRDLPFRESGLIGGTPPRDAQDRETLLISAVYTAVKRLLGPASGSSDPLLSSAAAERAARLHLWQVAGVDPTSKRPPRG